MKDHFQWGPTVSIGDLPEDVAIMLLGRPVYEALRHSIAQTAVGEVRKGSLRVKAVSRSERTITVEWQDDE